MPSTDFSLQRIRITTGPGRIAYRFDRELNSLEIWVGESVDDAPPATNEANSSTGFTWEFYAPPSPYENPCAQLLEALRSEGV